MNEDKKGKASNFILIYGNKSAEILVAKEIRPKLLINMCFQK